MNFWANLYLMDKGFIAIKNSYKLAVGPKGVDILISDF